MLSIPHSPLGIVQYAFHALGRDRLTFTELWLFISFEMRRMVPSKAQKMIHQLAKEGLLNLDGKWVALSNHAKTRVIERQPATSLASLGELLKPFVSSSRLSRAVGMDDSAVEIIRKTVNPLQVEAVIHGTRDYFLLLDESRKVIAHDCPDWQRTRLLHRFCKHVAKLFLILTKDEAIHILSSMQRESWNFTVMSKK